MGRLMSTAAPALLPAKRAALRLPPGSVRAIHVLGIVALICAIILLPDGRTIPPYLIYLLFIMLGHYFAAHGVTIASRDDPAPSPLFLPGGTVRLVTILALCGCVGLRLYSDHASGTDRLKAQFAESLKDLQEQPFLPLAILGGFFLGVAVQAVMRRFNKPAWWLDVEAWFSLIALIGLGIAGMIHLIIEPSADVKLIMPISSAILGGVVAFYFGERS
jgi:uncharacterized membrane protein